MKTSTDFFQIFCAISVHKKAAKKHPAQGFGKICLMTTRSNGDLGHLGNQLGSHLGDLLGDLGDLLGDLGLLKLLLCCRQLPEPCLPSQQIPLIWKKNELDKLWKM